MNHSPLPTVVKAQSVYAASSQITCISGYWLNTVIGCVNLNMLNITMVIAQQHTELIVSMCMILQKTDLRPFLRDNQHQTMMGR